MSGIYDIEVTVVSQRGTCGVGHKAGDKWLVGSTTPGGVCLGAYRRIETYIEILKYGGSFPWSQDPHSCRSVCPDTNNPVVFEIKRIRKHTQ